MLAFRVYKVAVMERIYFIFIYLYGSNRNGVMCCYISCIIYQRLYYVVVVAAGCHLYKLSTLQNSAITHLTQTERDTYNRRRKNNKLNMMRNLPHFLRLYLKLYRY